MSTRTKRHHDLTYHIARTLPCASVVRRGPCDMITVGADQDVVLVVECDDDGAEVAAKRIGFGAWVARHCVTTDDVSRLVAEVLAAN